MRLLTLGSLPLILGIVTGCASNPEAYNDMSWLDERAFRDCLGVKVPLETIRDPGFKGGTASLQIEMLPSGNISGVWIVSGSGNAALDEYLRRRLSTMQCGRISTLESREPYSVILDITIEVER